MTSRVLAPVVRLLALGLLCGCGDIHTQAVGLGHTSDELGGGAGGLSQEPPAHMPPVSGGGANDSPADGGASVGGGASAAPAPGGASNSDEEDDLLDAPAVAGQLCSPCTRSSQCGVSGDLCVTFRNTDNYFCGKSCQDDDDCPEGYECLPPRNTENSEQCVPKSRTCPPEL